MQFAGCQDFKYVDPPRTTIDRPVTGEEAESYVDTKALRKPSNCVLAGFYYSA
ncbi:hypothetical protein MHA01_05350 [Marinococcus halophilus]|uniref:Uncharacterized protein n=1 Tax=Marinococcus halophilus TaxID=1371 RepID=A0A510Y2S4_MARHA|nr:hypothetical protein MHA01_05350 [Marinococcus halophilus]